MLYNNLNLRNFEQTSEWTKDEIENAILCKTLNKKLNDETMLMYAIKVGDDSLAKRLIDLGASLNIGDSQNRTPLWLCSIYNRDNIAKYLLENGADMEEEEGHNSPLYNAIKFDNNEVAEVLIDMGANVNLENRDSQTPLHCAVFRDNYDMVEYLLKHGANKNIKNNIKPLPGEILFEEPKRQSPYDIAIEHGDEDLIELFEKNYDMYLNNESNIELDKQNQDKNIIVLDTDKEAFETYLFNNFKIEEYKNEIDSINEDYDFKELEEALDDSEKSGYKNGYDIMDSFSKGETFNYKNIFSDLKDKFYNIKQKINQLYSEKTSLINENTNLDYKEENLMYEIDDLKSEIDDCSFDLSKTDVDKKKFFYGNFLGYLLVNINPLLFFIISIIKKINFLAIILEFILIFFIVFYFKNFKYFIEFPYKRIFSGKSADYKIYDEKEYDFQSKEYSFNKAVVLIISSPFSYIGYILFIRYNFNISGIYSLIISLLFVFCIQILFYISYENSIRKKYIQIKQDKIIKMQEEKMIQLKELEEKLNNINKEEDNEKIKINNIKIEEIDKEIEDLKDKIDINEIKDLYSVINKEIYKKYNVEQAIIIKRWNEFSKFRRTKYNRIVEENLKKSKIFSKLNSLIDKKNELIDICYNTKNCEGNGKIEDYVNYIYDKIDNIDEKL